MSIQIDLSGKTALVTGASKGIGRATALALAQAGAQVIVHYGNSEKEAAAVVDEIRSVGGKAEKVAADLRTAEGPRVLAERVRAIVGGRLDVLVANAGNREGGNDCGHHGRGLRCVVRGQRPRPPTSWYSSCYP